MPCGICREVLSTSLASLHLMGSPQMGGEKSLLLRRQYSCFMESVFIHLKMHPRTTSRRWLTGYDTRLNCLHQSLQCKRKYRRCHNKARSQHGRHIHFYVCRRGITCKSAQSVNSNLETLKTFLRRLTLPHTLYKNS